MKRRNFLKRSGLITAGAFSAPFILPSGRLFAKTMDRKVNHVVFCLFAGGIRNIESVHQEEGNLMPGILRGTDSSIPGLDPMPASPWPTHLQASGTLFPELRYASGPTGHFNGHTVALTGAYTNTGLNLRANPQAPTVFEYYLKHNSPAVTAKNAWWVSNALGPYPALNYSVDPDYGPIYGANHIAPTSLLGSRQVFGRPKQFQFHEEEKIVEMRDFLNRNFDKSASSEGKGNINTKSDTAEISSFLAELVQNLENGNYNMPLDLPPDVVNGDIYNMVFAEEIIRKFTPELLVVNMTDVDICHSNFSQYCNNLRKADYAVAHLWSTIQSIPEMADDTVLILLPEHGRNFQSNSVMDIYGRAGLDHTGDETSREIFSLILGPSDVIRQDQVVGTASSPVGESIDLVPTIANLLGFDVNIPSGRLTGRVLNEALV